VSIGWELARQKRTTAIKALEQQGILKVNTDDIGNQYLSLPWLPNRKVPYKSLSITQRLSSEVAAGALGEIAKDALLHAVDTAKNRKQAKKKATPESLAADALALEADASEPMSVTKLVTTLKDLYRGFPVVLASSLPQGGVFFLVKKGTIEAMGSAFPTAPKTVASIVPIGLGCLAYWIFRTPAEVIKTQVCRLPQLSCLCSVVSMM
jgi:Mitochondrial carrier protein